MKSLLKLLVLILPVVTVQACTSNTPEQSEDVRSESLMPKEFSTRFSSDKIKKEREALYLQRRLELKRKNPTADVNNALRVNDIYLMAVPAGRGGSRSFPGLVEPQIITVNCKTVSAEGMGDVLYGENHRLYRQELLQYMRKFNTLMSPYCK